MNDIVVGVVTIKYNEQGRITYAEFDPEKQVFFDVELMEGIADIPPSDDSASIASKAQSILAKYFAKVNEIDMSDHFENGWDSEILSCDKYDSGQVRECKIKFTFKEL